MSATTSTSKPDRDMPGLAELERLIAQRDVKIVYQPIVCLRSGELRGFEALARPGGGSGFAHPGELFEVATRFGRLWDLERVTRELALDRAADFPDGVLLFLNNTPQVLTDRRFVPTIEEEIRSRPGLTPARLVMEVTEHLGSDDTDALVSTVWALKSMGAQIAIDDVGAGINGLARVMLVRPQWLKLDRSLIERIDGDPYKLNLIRFFVNFARLSGVHILAEGIERPEDLDVLMSTGVRFGQGFLLARPAPGYQLPDPEVVQRIRRHAELTRPGSDSEVRDRPLRALVRPARLEQASTPMGECAAELLKLADCPGVVVLDGRRCVGWVDRQTVLKAAQGVASGDPLAYAVRGHNPAMSSDATVRQALEVLSLRSDAELAHPILITDVDRVMGVVSVQSLLGAAAGQRDESVATDEPLTTLPSRVAAEQRVDLLIDEARRAPANAGHMAAAMIDLRAFAAFNASAGYDAGNRLIRSMGSLLQREVRLAPERRSVPGHRGDERTRGSASAGDGSLRRRTVASAAAGNQSAADLDAGDVLRYGVRADRRGARTVQTRARHASQGRAIRG
jgi:EAL domain-containing protein (putative c-di-GMP-specific phosphodiesterase class I)